MSNFLTNLNMLDPSLVILLFLRVSWIFNALVWLPFASADRKKLKNRILASLWKYVQYHPTFLKTNFSRIMLNLNKLELALPGTQHTIIKFHSSKHIFYFRSEQFVPVVDRTAIQDKPSTASHYRPSDIIKNRIGNPIEEIKRRGVETERSEYEEIFATEPAKIRQRSKKYHIW